MPDNDHKALGPALGYVYQFERATYRLLEADSTVVSVAVEYVDDVSVHRADGMTTREQDKLTTIKGRPLSDRSVALWKTISIWANSVIADAATLNSTEFHLVTNGEVSSNCLAARIHAAKTDTEMTTVAEELIQMAKAGLREELEPFAVAVNNIQLDMLSALVGKIFVFDKVSASFGGDLEKLQSLRYFSKVQREAIFNNASAWVRRHVLDAALKGTPTLIDRATFDREVRALFRSISVAPLACVFETQDSMVDPANYQSHGFFQQLDWVDTDPDFVRECVIHYAQAQSARVKWADSADISEASLRAYEDDLKSRWKLHVQRQANQTYPSKVAQGKERLLETLSEESTLDGQPMPKAITCGSFHALANFDALSEPRIGWHPEFENLAKTPREAVSILILGSNHKG